MIQWSPGTPSGWRTGVLIHSVKRCIRRTADLRGPAIAKDLCIPIYYKLPVEGCLRTHISCVRPRLKIFSSTWTGLTDEKPWPCMAQRMPSARFQIHLCRTPLVGRGGRVPSLPVEGTHDGNRMLSRFFPSIFWRYMTLQLYRCCAWFPIPSSSKTSLQTVRLWRSISWHQWWVWGLAWWGFSGWPSGNAESIPCGEGTSWRDSTLPHSVVHPSLSWGRQEIGRRWFACRLAWFCTFRSEGTSMTWGLVRHMLGRLLPPPRWLCVWYQGIPMWGCGHSGIGPHVLSVVLIQQELRTSRKSSLECFLRICLPRIWLIYIYSELMYTFEPYIHVQYDVFQRRHVNIRRNNLKSCILYKLNISFLISFTLTRYQIKWSKTSYINLCHFVAMERAYVFE